VGIALILAILLGSVFLSYTKTAGSANASKTVHGYVWPMVTQEWAAGFMEGHAIVVELRETINTPALEELTTTAALLDNDGNGEFTFEDVQIGDYVLVIKRPGYLTRCMNVTVSDSGSGIIELAPPNTDITDEGIFKLWWGDCDGNLVVDGDDSVMMTELWNTNANNPNYDPSCDLDGNGRIDNSDALLLMMHYGYSAAQYAGAEDVDALSDLGTYIPIKLTVSQDEEYLVPISVRNISTFTGKTITVTYNPAMLQLKNTAEHAYGAYTAVGAIPDTGVTIKEITQGSVKLAFDMAVPQGKPWSGVITVFRFQALDTGITTVSVE